MKSSRLLICLSIVLAAATARAEVGDPQVATDHPWYSGELDISTFDRLFATEAKLYKRVVGKEPKTDEEKALAAWFYRNTHYAHGEEGHCDLWEKGYKNGINKTNDYWTGLFADGFGLCGTTHAQWTAEMEYLLGHGRGRDVGVSGHNSFEVYLKGGPYGEGKWVLLDHDTSTVIYNKEGTALIGIPEIMKDLKEYGDPKFKPDRQHGWLVSGLHPSDARGVYDSFRTAEYFAGYAGPPPMVLLRRGETLRRYPQPGLEDGKTFVFWGHNYNAGGIPGPYRDRTWVNQPEKMYQAKHDAGGGSVRYANAVYTYKPNFANGDYHEGVTEENDSSVTFSFDSPYIVAATPADMKGAWAIYDPGCKNGLVLHGKADCTVSISVNGGKDWKDAGKFSDGLDVTDLVKGQRYYLIRFGASAKKLADSGLSMVTICQANTAVLPRLKDGGSVVRFDASGKAVESAANLSDAKARVVAGALDSNTVTLELGSPQKEPLTAVYAVAQVASGAPPKSEVKYQIDYSTDGGKTWASVVKDWQIPMPGEQPKDFWSQSFCYGTAAIDKSDAKSVQVRFKNDGGKKYLRAEVHVVYKVPSADATKVTFDWTDSAGEHKDSHTFDKAGEWTVPTKQKVVTKWVEFEDVPGKSLAAK